MESRMMGSVPRGSTGPRQSATVVLRASVLLAIAPMEEMIEVPSARTLALRRTSGSSVSFILVVLFIGIDLRCKARIEMWLRSLDVQNRAGDGRKYWA